MLPSLLSLARSRRLSHSIRAGRATTPRGEDRRIDIETFDFETFEVRALWSSRMTDVEIVLCVVFTCVSHNSHTQSVCTVYHIKHAFHTRLDTYNFVIADAGSHVLNGATPRRAAGEEFRTPEISSTYSCSRSPPWRGIKKPGPCSLASSLAACGPPARRRAAAAGARQVEG